MHTTELNPLTAGLLEASASGYAAAASGEFQRRSGPSDTDAAFSIDRRAYFVQRILELAAAIRVEAPELFVQRTTWLRRALLARGADDGELRDALISLRDALRGELPKSVLQTAIAPIESALAEFVRVPEPERSELDAGDPLGRLALRYLETCLTCEPERATAIVLDSIDSVPPERLLTHVIAPAEREIGRMWHAGEVTIAEERLVSETTRRLLAVIAQRCAKPTRIGRTALSASVSGNIHDLGAAIAADLFRLAGWRSIFLGATLPADQLSRAVTMFDVDAVVLSVTLATQLGEAANAIEAVRATSPDARVVVGGAAFDDAPSAWRRLGADAYAARLDEVVATAARLFDPSPAG